MIKIKIGHVFFAVITFIVVSLVIVLNGFNMSRSDASTAGTSFLKYTYATNTTISYTLPEVSTTNVYTLQRGAISDYIENRPIATNYEGVVEINEGGTGFIIGENTVMTAAHCVINRTGFSDNCTIKIPDSNPCTDASKTVSAISAHVPKIFANKTCDAIDNATQGLQSYDYAILTIDVDDLDLPEEKREHGLLNYGSFILGMVTNDFTSREIPVHCMGFYNEYIKSSDVNYNSTLPINMGDLCFDFNLTTYFKTSGGPIYTESVFGVQGAGGEYGINTYRTAISIVSGITENNINVNQIITVGTRIRPEIMQFAYGNDYL